MVESIRPGVLVNRNLMLIVLAITMAFIGPAVNQVFLAYHGPDESLNDHLFTSPAFSDTAGDSASLALGIILFILISWLSIQFWKICAAVYTAAGITSLPLRQGAVNRLE